MHNDYRDITERIGEPPKWYDENAVPRYSDFKPDDVANIYAEEVALVHIGCQHCRRPFNVAFASGPFDSRWRKDGTRIWNIAEWITDGSLHYGDPPNAGCCLSGASMNCDDFRVLEYWRKGDDFNWHRDASFEIALPDGQDASAGRGDNDAAEESSLQHVS